MGRIDETKVLDFYICEMDKDTIEFLKNKPWYKEELKKHILKLRDETEMHNKITICKDLWKVLFESAMSFINPDRRGYDDLFQFFDEYVNFEELIFASDSFYRDHTMHCLWVYFLGEYILKNKEFEDICQSYLKENVDTWNLCDNILKKSKFKELFTDLIEFGETTKDISQKGDSLWCLSALTHDLGYPLKKISAINKNIKNIIPHFGIKSYSEFDFSYSDIHDNLIKDFLNFISFRFRHQLDGEEKDMQIIGKVFITDKRGNAINIDEAYIETLKDEEKQVIKNNNKVNRKLVFDYSRHMRYSKDFENYQHGIMSAFLLFRKLAVYSNSGFRYTDYSDIDIRRNDFVANNLLSNLLCAVTDHTSEGYQMEEINDLSAFLTFVDELEEFSRISRANQNRQYINEFCKSDIYVEEGYLNIDFIFDNLLIDNLDPERAFKGRCKRFLTLFNISELDKKLKIKLRCIGNLPYDNNVYMLEIRNKFANITINEEEKNIPQYLKSKQFLTKEAYILS